MAIITNITSMTIYKIITRIAIWTIISTMSRVTLIIQQQ